MFHLFIYVFLIFQCQTSVYTNSVIEWTPDNIGAQLTFPWQKKATVIIPHEYIIKSPSGEPYTVKCDIYEHENPKADIFTKDGIFIDSLTLVSLETDACDPEQLKYYVIPQDPEKGIVKMVYLWSGKSPSCVKRTYTINEYSFMVVLKRSSYPPEDCPKEVTEFLNGFSDADKHTAGGVVSVAPLEPGHVMDYTRDLLKQGTPDTKIFPEKDLKGKEFKFICRKDTLTREDPTTQKNTVLTGWLVNDDFEDVVMDKFKLASCDISQINVNRQIIDGDSRFKVVFKTNKGLCYEREYEYYNVNRMHYFDECTVVRNKAKKVKCPKTFVGDVNLNAHRPWYKWLFFIKNKKYSVEVSEL